ncbi:MAG: MBL fold metallo-hydrolase [Lentisphaeria bacterium]|nr:MBL fold metallo-hydrolase [Lentisphaeria bacterium]
MKIHIITTGTLICRKNLIEPDSGNEKIAVEVSCLLLAHESGEYALFDTGQTPPEVPQSPDAPFQINVDENESCAAQLKSKYHLTPADISAVILSHAHRDHYAGLRDFPGIKTFMHENESRTSEGSFIMKKYPQQWQLFSGELDIFGDGSAIVVPTPRHTPGHCSLKTGNTLYAADAACTVNCISNAPELKKFAGLHIVPGHKIR